MTFFRNGLGVGAGLIGAVAIIFVTESIGHRATRDDGAFAVAVAGYFLGAAAGTAIACRIAGPKTAVLVPLLLAILAAINLFSFLHPGWFAPAAAAALALGWFIGIRLLSRSVSGGRRAGTDA